MSAPKDTPATNPCHGTLVDGLVLTAIVAVLSALVVDFGETFRLTLIALLLFWGWVVVTVYRRPSNPTRIDLWLIRWGSVPFTLLFQVVTHAVWHWRGLE